MSRHHERTTSMTFKKEDTMTSTAQQAYRALLDAQLTARIASRDTTLTRQQRNTWQSIADELTARVAFAAGNRIVATSPAYRL